MNEEFSTQKKELKSQGCVHVLQSWRPFHSPGFVLALSAAPVTHDKAPHVAFKPKRILG